MMNPRDSMYHTRNLVLLALLTALAIAVRGLEALIPNPLPWVRIGLANILTLLAILFFGLSAGLLVTILRVVIASVLFGTLLSPPFLLSLSAGMASTLVMGLAHRWGARLFSPIGLSVLGAVTHNAVQLLVAYVVIIRQAHIFYLLPLLLVIGILTGCFNGWVVVMMAAHLRGQIPDLYDSQESADDGMTAGPL
jgi:heptaprenyl diphosphate synthase